MQKINLKTQSWCVKNDGSQLFKDTVVKYLNEKDNEEYSGEGDGYFYGIGNDKLVWILTDPFGTVLTIPEFLEAVKDEKLEQVADKLKDRVLFPEHVNAIKGNVVFATPSNGGEKTANGWVSVEDRLPTGGTTGHWDGTKSHPILAIDKDEVCHVCVVYHGILDGNRFADFYTLNDFDVPNITHWMHLPLPPYFTNTYKSEKDGE